MANGVDADAGMMEMMVRRIIFYADDITNLEMRMVTLTIFPSLMLKRTMMAITAIMIMVILMTDIFCAAGWKTSAVYLKSCATASDQAKGIHTVRARRQHLTLNCTGQGAYKTFAYL